MSQTGSTKRFWLMWGVGLAVVMVAVTFAVMRFLAVQQIEQAGHRFMLLNSLRKQALVEYLETAKTELTFWSLNADLQNKQAELVRRWQAYAANRGSPGSKLREVYVTNNPYADGMRRELDDAGDGSRYSELHAQLHPLAKLFVVERGYYDFFLISPEGDILYSVEKEADFGTNLSTGPWRHSGLADVYQRALALALDDAVVISDLGAYGPSGYAPAMFMARVMKDRQDEILGVLAFQLPTDSIRNIMQFHAGMGDSGETYLVGEDRLMRSPSRFSEQSTVLKQKVTTEAVERALNGERGVMITADYRGVPVLSAYDSEKIDAVRWAILAEIDRDEVLRNAAQLYPQIAGLMAFLYALAMASLWFLRSPGTGADDYAGGIDADNDYTDLPG